MTSSPSSGGLAESAARLLESAEQHFTPCGNGRLQWQQWSDAGPPLLLLHGGFGSWNHWYANIDRLRRERALWTLDMPGLGASGDVFRQARPQHFAAIIAPGLRRFMGRRSVDIAAFSFGAMVGVHLVDAVRCSRFFAIGAAGCGALHVQVPLEAPPRDDSAAFDVHRRNLRALMFSAGFPI
ncbi:MAG: alpha/beta hydrolase, partial [Halieaceae bacterium]|nr:alpha/beta hydrolase [Halieaceae bacterium]